MLISLDDLKRELAGLEFVHAVQIERTVQEGSRHTGLASVVQVMGITMSNYRNRFVFWATLREIKTRHRELVKRHHPDSGNASNPEMIRNVNALHRMHHTDLVIDVTTGNRFHPIEIVISAVIKQGAVALIGPPVVAVVAFEVALNATSQFNHGNILIPEALDRWLRLVAVTPDMHRVHHSVIPRETNSNFGFNLPWWDRLCGGTYRAQPEAGHGGMTIGLKEFRDPGRLTLFHLLIQPFFR